MSKLYRGDNARCLSSDCLRISQFYGATAIISKKTIIIFIVFDKKLMIFIFLQEQHWSDTQLSERLASVAITKAPLNPRGPSQHFRIQGLKDPIISKHAKLYFFPVWVPKTRKFFCCYTWEIFPHIVWSVNRDFISIHYGNSNALKKVSYVHNIFSIYIRLWYVQIFQFFMYRNLIFFMAL